MSTPFEGERAVHIPPFTATAVTGRPLDIILGMHGLPERVFEGKTVYDLGCGRSDLQRDLAERAINATVIGFDANPGLFRNLDPDEYVTDIRRARLHELPVEDETGDIVLATYSYPMYARTEEELRGFFREGRRVTKPNGILSILPLSVKDPRLKAALDEEIASITQSPSWLVMNRPNIQHLTARKLESAEDELCDDDPHP